MVGKTAIQINDLSKRYRIGMKKKLNTTLVESIIDTVKKPIKNFKILRSLKKFSGNEHAEDIIWAVKDISFDIAEGEAVGIIGRNGSGKSTLLKILSRITEPTQGRVQIDGRVASLLEVGTGFHPELTGRENIYLNGAILGMRKSEIDRKLDEIVAFSGVDRFIDTPIKRYSSGMNVRLAFSVAAHLEPEILIIDEVLAVGDVEFQKKCLGKMDNVAKSGRTVIFVSHNLGAVQTLCSKGIVLDSGKLKHEGSSQSAVQFYLNEISSKTNGIDLISRKDRKGNGKVKVCSFRVLDSNNQEVQMMKSGNDYTIEIGYRNFYGKRFENVVVSLDVFDEKGNQVLIMRTNFQNQNVSLSENSGYLFCKMNELPLANGSYSFLVYISYRDAEILDWISDVARIPIAGGNFFGTSSQGFPEKCKFLYKCNWSSS